MKTVAILVPCHNEDQILEATVARLNAVCREARDVVFSLVFVDDGSTDETLGTLLRLREREEGLPLRIVQLSRNFGKESALTAGLDLVTEDACIILDADLQDPPEAISELLAGWREGYDVVAIRRADRSTDTEFKKRSAQLFYKIFNWFSDIKIPDNVGDARLIDRSVIDALGTLPENTRFMKGLFAWVGFKTKIIDVRRAPRLAGVSRLNPLKLVLLALDGLTSFSSSLLRLWIWAGVLASLLAFALGLRIIVRTLLIGVEVPGYASLTVMLLFFSGIQMIGIGVIGEYVGRSFIEAKRRPAYVVKRVYD